MKNMKILLAGIAASFMFVACGSSDSADVATGALQVSLSDTSVNTGAIALTDEIVDFQAVYVTIKEVRVHVTEEKTEEEGTETAAAEEAVDTDVADDQEVTPEEENGWMVVASPNKTFNLLELQNGVEAVLGEATLEVGKYTQMRLILDIEADAELNINEETHPYANYVVVNGEYFEVNIPSSFESGIKLIKGFTVKEGETTNIVIDFDAEDSFKLLDGVYKMNPTIKIIEEK